MKLNRYAEMLVLFCLARITGTQGTKQRRDAFLTWEYRQYGRDLSPEFDPFLVFQLVKPVDVVIPKTARDEEKTAL